MSTMTAIAPRASCSALAGTGSGFDQQGTLEFGQRGDAGRLVWKSFGASHYLASQIFAAPPSFSAAKGILRGDAITINAGPDDVINLTRVSIDGIKIANNGIMLNSCGSLRITHRVVRHCVSTRICLQATSKTTY
jgi:hypothetical protein